MCAARPARPPRYPQVLWINFGAVTSFFPLCDTPPPFPSHADNNSEKQQSDSVAPRGGEKEGAAREEKPEASARGVQGGQTRSQTRGEAATQASEGLQGARARCKARATGASEAKVGCRESAAAHPENGVQGSGRVASQARPESGVQGRGCPPQARPCQARPYETRPCETRIAGSSSCSSADSRDGVTGRVTAESASARIRGVDAEHGRTSRRVVRRARRLSAGIARFLRLHRQHLEIGVAAHA